MSSSADQVFALNFAEQFTRLNAVEASGLEAEPSAEWPRGESIAILTATRGYSINRNSNNLER